MSTRGDGLRERDRYGRASLSEQLAGELKALRGQPWLLLVLLFVVGGGVVLLLLRPQVVQVTSIAAGDCLYIRSGDADSQGVGTGRRIGTDTGVILALYENGAERASCDLSHSHEVAEVPRFAENAVATYPGSAALTDRLRARCQAAFQAYVGRPVEGSAFDLVIAVPPEEAWTNGIRRGACLVGRADGEFMEQHARGSGG